MPVFLIQAKPHKTCVERSGKTLGRGFLAVWGAFAAEVSERYRNPMGRQGFKTFLLLGEKDGVLGEELRLAHVHPAAVGSLEGGGLSRLIRTPPHDQGPYLG